MEIQKLEKNFDKAMTRWEIAFTENNGNVSALERELSRKAFWHYHNWQMALKEEAWLKAEQEPKIPTGPLRKRPYAGQAGSQEMDQFWREYAENSTGIDPDD